MNMSWLDKRLPFWAEAFCVKIPGKVARRGYFCYGCAVV